MPTIAEELQAIDDFNGLLPFLKDRMGWRIDPGVLEEDDPIEEATFQVTLEKLGIDPKKAPNIRRIQRLRPLVSNQPFGVFFIYFEDKQLKVTTMRRILRALVITQRQSAKSGTQQLWNPSDLMFLTSLGVSGHRKLSFAHFHEEVGVKKLPTLRVIGWDEDDTPMRMKVQATVITEKLKWPDNPSDIDSWREQWSKAFSYRPEEVIRTTKELVAQLAVFATRTCEAIEEVLAIETPTGVFHRIMNSFRQTIFPDLKPEAFADMYAQTVTYGLLQDRMHDQFSQTDGIVLENVANFVKETNPFLKELFEIFLSFGRSDSNLDFDEIGLSDVQDLLSNSELEQIIADFRRRRQDPNIHLYESFLEQYDKNRKVKHGVFYTPKEVVEFIVRSAHEALRKDFGLVDGLADISTWAECATKNDGVIVPEGWADRPFVQILDPATGTGTFMIEAIQLIFNHMMDKWRNEGKSDQECSSLWQTYVPVHLLPRLHGFELMMAPYAIAHLGIALKLIDTGFDYRNSKMPRAGVYLTNSLAKLVNAEEQTEMNFLEDELADEGRGANSVKRDMFITVVIGNPPYSGHSMNTSKDSNQRLTWIGELIQPYFNIDGERLEERNLKWLNDDYVKFIRFGEYLIAKSGYGVLAYITNHSFISNPTFRGMRKHLIDNVSSLRILDLHGVSSASWPNGLRDINVFNIKQGVAITLMVKNGNSNPMLTYCSFPGSREEKFKFLSEETMLTACRESVRIRSPFFFFINRNDKLASEFQSFASLKEIMPVNSVGIVTARDKLCIQMSNHEIEETLANFVNLKPEYARLKFSLPPDANDWKVQLAQADVKMSKGKTGCVTLISYRPFDNRFTFYSGKSKGFICRPRSKVMRHMTEGDNIGLVTVRQVAEGVFNHCIVVNNIVESRMTLSLQGISLLFPLKLYYINDTEKDISTNLSVEFLDHLGRRISLDFQPIFKSKLNQTSSGVSLQKAHQKNLIESEICDRGNLSSTFGFRDAFDYIYSILHCSSYRDRYAEFLKYDYPRIPLPSGRELFSALVSLGRELVSLHLLDDKHSKLTKPKIYFRGRGDNRLFGANEIKWDNGLIWINENQWFEDVPKESFEFLMCGYQPLRKWLCDRASTGGRNPTPGRVLDSDDVTHYCRMVVAITETRRIMQEIDQTINDHGGWSDAFVIDIVDEQ